MKRLSNKAAFRAALFIFIISLINLSVVKASASSKNRALPKGKTKQELHVVKAKFDAAFAEAQEKLLLKKREDGIKILLPIVNELYENEKSFNNIYSSAIEKISKAFVSEKVQQEFEIILSTGNDKEQVSKLNTLLESDPFNVEIALQILKKQIDLKDCDLADKQIKKFEELAKHIEELSLIKAQYLLCLKREKEFGELITKIDLENTKEKDAWQLLEIEKEFLSGNIEKVKQILQNSNKTKSENIEYAYWNWIINQSSTESAKKYIEKCKSETALSKRMYSYVYRYCDRVEEVSKKIAESEKQSL